MKHFLDDYSSEKIHDERLNLWQALFLLSTIQIYILQVFEVSVIRCYLAMLFKTVQYTGSMGSYPVWAVYSVTFLVIC